MSVYPFTEPLKIMKPCKIDPTKKSQVSKMHQILNGKKFLWEEKLDGHNIMSIGGRLFANTISKETGFPTEKTEMMPKVSKILEPFGKMILDGEAYLPGFKSNNVSSYLNCLPENSIEKQDRDGYIQYWVYDILRLPDGTWVHNKPFWQRRKMLEELFAFDLCMQTEIKLNRCYKSEEQDPQAAFDEIISRGLEGIVLKDANGLYHMGKRPMYNQIKMKASMEDDVVIIGFNEATKKYTGKDLANWPYWIDGEPVTSNYYNGLIGSIQIGQYKNGILTPVGNVTGLTDDERKDMTEHPDKYLNKVIMIKAMEKTEDGLFRHANYKGLHADKRAEECVYESESDGNA